MGSRQWVRGLVVGAAAAVFERGAVSASDPITRSAAHYTDNRAALLAQALLFVIGSGFFLWFVASLRSFLMRAAEHCSAIDVGLRHGGLDDGDARRACLSDGLGGTAAENAGQPVPHDQHDERTLYGRQPAPQR